MAGKPILHYFDGRGRMEPIRWLLAAAGEEFEEKLMKTPEDLKKLRNDGSLMFQQVPMVEIDGMTLVQTRAILNYIAAKHNLYGKDIKERALIDIYSEGVADLNEIILHYPFLPPGDKDGSLTQIKEKSRNFPAFEKGFLVMAGKPVLHYFNGRGRMESIRWLLAAAGVEFEEKFFETREEFEKLIQGGTLMYERVPMVEMDGMNLVESRAILRYIAAKYGLYGRNLKEQAWIDMYVEGLRDLSDMIMYFPLSLPEEKEMNLEYILQRATMRFFPVYEKEFKVRISHIPTIYKFLQPGSQRKPPLDEESIKKVKKIFKFENGMFLKNMSTIEAEY
uniref:glutathione transferase n=2 Tax=Urocitellus parryii TaxID=9999 RepID=A0A8D2KM81_UROPR